MSKTTTTNRKRAKAASFTTKALTVAGLVGGIATSYAGIAGTISPRAGFVLATTAVIAASAGDSISQVAKAMNALRKK